MKKIKIGKFGIGLLIYSGVLILVMGIIIAVLCSFLSTFERNQPERAAEKYISELDETKLKELINKIFTDASKFETVDTVYASTPFANTENKIRFLKKVDEYTAQRPVYFISCAGRNLGKFSLLQNGKDSFGMTKWTADDGELFLSEILSEPAVYTVKVPFGSTVTVNGIELDAEYITAENEIYSGNVYLSASQAESLKCVIYTLPPLRFIPKVTLKTETSDAPLVCQDTLFDGFETDAVSIKVTAPSNAAVMLEGIRIPSEYFTLTDKAIEVSEFEKNTSIKLPTEMFCRIPRITSIEALLATASGKPMSLSENENGFIAEYGADSLISVEILVPEDCEISLNGIKLREKYQTGNGIFTMVKDIEALTGDIPPATVYKINGLFQAPEISVSRGGAVLPVCYKKELGGLTRHEYYGPDSDMLRADAEERVLGFADAYIKYTSSGYSGLDENYSAVMQYMYPKSKAYELISSTKKSYYWAENYSITDKSIECGEFVRLSENCFFCSVDYRVALKKYSYTREESGIMRLVLIKRDGVWSIAEFLSENK